MSRLFLAELRKLLYRRSLLLLVLVLTALVGLTVLLFAVLARTDAAPPGGAGLPVASLRLPAGYLLALETTISQAGVLGVILGALAMGNEYGWGTVTTTLVREPRRGRFLLAKAAAVAVVAAAGVAVSAVPALAIAALGHAIAPDTVPAYYTGGWVLPALGVVARGAAGVVAWSMVGLAAATVGRGLAIGLSAGIGFYFLESILGIWSEARGVLLGSAVQRLGTSGFVESTNTLGGSPVEMGLPRASVVTAAYAIVVVAVSVIALRRRDVPR